MSACPIEITTFDEAGYRPIVDFGAWRVAILNYIDELLPERIHEVQQHAETDEVFVKLAGECLLFTADVSDGIATQIHACPMESGKIYNVPRGVYHTHTLTPGAKVLIVENADTNDANSPRAPLSETQRAEIVRLSQQFLHTHV